MTEHERPGSMDGMLLVANYDSNVGYAWWLMESFWVTIARHVAGQRMVFLAYPSISTIPVQISEAPIVPLELNLRITSFTQLLLLLRTVRGRSIRTIYLTDWPASHWLYPVLRAAGVRRIIVHDHTPGKRTAPTGIKRWLKRQLHSVPIWSADGLIAATSFVHDRHLNVTCFPAVRCFTAENGLPVLEHVGIVDVHRLFGIPRDRRIVVAVGRAHRVKGVSTVLRAMAKLVHDRARGDVHFLFCGDGPHLEEFFAESRTLGIDPFVTFGGRQANVNEILRGCDIAIHASTSEVGYSLAILEAMRAGLPVVVSDDESVCGATVDKITGLHFRLSDPTAAADALTILLEDNGLSQRMGEAGKSLIHTRFALENTHGQLLESLEAIEAGFTSSHT